MLLIKTHHTAFQETFISCKPKGLSFFFQTKLYYIKDVSCPGAGHLSS